VLRCQDIHTRAEDIEFRVVLRSRVHKCRDICVVARDEVVNN